jgi:hypothetical protein
MATGKILLLGQPKDGKVLIFYYENEWNLFQEIKLDGFSYKFDIDSEEKTLVVTNKNERTTNIYENISYDLRTMSKNMLQISNNVSTTDYVTKYYESVAYGYKNIIIDQKDLNPNPPAVPATLYTTIPYYIPSDGNMIMSIYESIQNNRYLYHIYGNDISGSQIESQMKLLIYSQSGETRLKSITSDRNGGTILMVRENGLGQLYKKVNLNFKDEIYAFIRMDNSDLRDIWTTLEYNPQANGSRVPIDKIRFNKRGNILFVEQGPNIVVLHYQQEFLIRQKLVGHPELGTDPSDNNIPKPTTDFANNRYVYFLNYYYLMSKPFVSYILNEKLLMIDDKDTLYTWKDDRIKVYGEDNLYRTSISTIPFQNLDFDNIKFFPEERLFTYKDETNIYFYYYDKINNSFTNTNVQIPICERYHIIDNHVIQYSNKNLKIDLYTIDVIQNINQIDLSLNTIYTDTIVIDPSYNLIHFSMDYLNQINILFREQSNTRYYNYVPTSRDVTKYKHMITFREQKIDVDVQYKHEEFYNNVIKVLPKNYTYTPQSNNIGENENQFKIYCPQKFTYDKETLNNELHTFTLNLNKNVYFSNDIVASKYFDMNQHKTLLSVLQHMEQVNDNRSTSLYRITEKRYVGIVATMKGGTNLVRHKYRLVNRKGETTLIHSPTYAEGVDDKITSRGVKFYQVTSDVYSQEALPDIPNTVDGIYLGNEIPIEDDLTIRYEVDSTFVDSLNYDIYYPENIEVYLMTELLINIVTEESVQNSSFIVRNDMEYGKFTNISSDGNMIVVGSEMETVSNVLPRLKRELQGKKSFNIIWEQSFDQNGGYDWEWSNSFEINWDVAYKTIDDGLEKFIDLTELNRFQKIEDYANQLKSYYGVDMIKLNYSHYYALRAWNVGGLGGTNGFFYINSAMVIKSGEYSRWDNDTLTSPSYYDSTDVPIQYGGTSFAEGSIDSASYILLSNGSRPSHVSGTVDFVSGLASYVSNIKISYVAKLNIEFTEEYLQRFFYNTIRYGCLFYYYREKGRWRHLNTLYFKNNRGMVPLRPSLSLVDEFQPDHIEIVNNRYVLYAKDKISNVIKNNILNLNNLVSEYYLPLPIEIDVKYDITTDYVNKYVGWADDTDGNFSYTYRNIDNRKLSTTTDNPENIIDELINFETILDLKIRTRGWRHWIYFTYSIKLRIKDIFDYIKSTLYNAFSLKKEIFDASVIPTNNLVNFESLGNFYLYTGSKDDNPSFIYNNVPNMYKIIEGEYEEDAAPDSAYNSHRRKHTLKYTNLSCKITFSSNLSRIYGLNSDIFEFDAGSNKILFLPKFPYYNIYIPNAQRKYFGQYLSQSSNIHPNTPIIIGTVDKFEVFDYSLSLISKFSIKDKIGYLYVNQDTVYNAIPEKSLIRKYTIPPPITPDPSYNNFPIVDGSELFQDYRYVNFGNSFSVFDNNYAVIGTTEGKVIIRHLSDKTAGTAVIDSGSSNYSEFGSVLKCGKNIYVNAPELNKLYVVSGIPYYE